MFSEVNDNKNFNLNDGAGFNDDMKCLILHQHFKEVYLMNSNEVCRIIFVSFMLVKK